MPPPHGKPSVCATTARARPCRADLPPLHGRPNVCHSNRTRQEVSEGGPGPPSYGADGGGGVLLCACCCPAVLRTQCIRVGIGVMPCRHMALTGHNSTLTCTQSAAAGSERVPVTGHNSTPTCTQSAAAGIERVPVTGHDSAPTCTQSAAAGIERVPGPGMAAAGIERALGPGMAAAARACQGAPTLAAGQGHGRLQRGGRDALPPRGRTPTRTQLRQDGLGARPPRGLVPSRSPRRPDQTKTTTYTYLPLYRGQGARYSGGVAGRCGRAATVRQVTRGLHRCSRYASCRPT